MLRASTNKVTLPIEDSVVDFVCDDLETLEKICQTPKQINYLKLIQQALEDISDDDEYIWLTDVVDLIIQYSEAAYNKEKARKGASAGKYSKNNLINKMICCKIYSVVNLDIVLSFLDFYLSIFGSLYYSYIASCLFLILFVILSLLKLVSP